MYVIAAMTAYSVPRRLQHPVPVRLIGPGETERTGRLRPISMRESATSDVHERGRAPAARLQQQRAPRVDQPL